MISTGIRKLDELLSGGISPGILVDVFGANSTGKTQLLMQLCISCIRNGGKVLYVDTTGDFRPERILGLQKKFNLDSISLKQISVSRVTNTHEQINSLKDFDSSYSLVLIDNITDLFSYEYQKDESVYEKNSIFMRYMSSLSKFSLANDVPIVMTNMIRTINGTETENMRAAISPYTHVKVHLLKEPKFYTGIVHSALGQNSFTYQIHELGLSDAEDI